MPRKQPEPAATPSTIAGWHARRGALLAKLHNDPDGPWAWLWRVHVDIVDYLLHRYAGDSPTAGSTELLERLDTDAEANTPDSVDLTPGIAPAPAPDAEPDLPRLHGSARVAKAASFEGPDAQRLRATLRDRLSSLNTTNDARRATQPRIRPAPPYRPLFSTLFLPPEKIRNVVRTTFPEDGWQPLDDDADVEPLDDTTLALFRQAIAYDQGWDLETAEALTEDDVMRLLLGEAVDTSAHDTDGT